MSILKKISITVILAVPLTSILMAMPHRIAANNQLKQWRDAGHPTTIEELRQRQTIPDSENGANVIRRAMDVVDQTTYDANPIMGRSGELPEPGEPFSPEAMEAMEKVLAANEETLAILQELMDYEVVIFSGDNFGMELRDWSLHEHMRNIARMLSEQAMYSLEKDNEIQCVEAIELIWHLGLIYPKYKNEVFFDVGFRVMETGLWNLQTLLKREQLGDYYLGELQRNLNDYTSIDLATDEIVTSFVVAYDQFLGPMLPTTPLLWGEQYSKFEFAIEAVNKVSEWVPHYARGKEWISEAYWEALTLTQGDIYQEPDSESILILKPWKNSTKRYYSLDFIYLAVHMNYRLQTEFRLAYIGVAIERYKLTHGELPSTLNDLVPELIESLPIDPFGGGQFEYQINSNEYTITSQGRMASDDSLRDSDFERKNPNERLAFTGRTTTL